MSLAKCPICKAPAKILKDPNTLRSKIACYRCGEFRSDHYALIALKRVEWTDQQIATASGYIRKNQELLLRSDDVDRLGSLPTPSPAEKAARLLIYLGQGNVPPGAQFIIAAGLIFVAMEKLAASSAEDEYSDDLLEERETQALEWLAVAAASNVAEFDWLLSKVLMGRGFLEKGNMFAHGSKAYDSVVITPAGWQEIERLQQVNVGSRIGFVAMRFNDEFKPLYDLGIEPGIRAAGYEAFRVDRKEHNNRIDDEIIASIKQSRFLVADFTESRGGIYFEAGFAMGLGLTVVWLAREDQLEQVHFDNRQYNFITWRNGEWDDLVKRLRFRIEATIGLGPLASPGAGQTSGKPGH